MPVAFGVAADDHPVQNVQRGEQRRGSVPLVLVRHLSMLKQNSPKVPKQNSPVFGFLVTSQLSRRFGSPFWAGLVFSAAAA